MISIDIHCLILIVLLQNILLFIFQIFWNMNKLQTGLLI
nr:MAG TPA: hypothetical protein [Caudoviricetes sp.]